MSCRTDDDDDEQPPGERLPLRERVVDGAFRWWLFRGSDTPFMTRIVIPLALLGMVGSLVMAWAENGYHFGR